MSPKKRGKQLDYVAISKTLAHALRHEPELYGLELDAEGWAAVPALLAALGEEGEEWKDLCEQDLHDTIANTNKRRYEIVSNKIRALYGHSLDIEISREAKLPPEVLFHGTSEENADLILDTGLQPVGRQHVHLSVTTETAQTVGGRKSAHPVVLRIRAVAAHEDGVRFYQASDDVWLAEAIHQRHITRQDG